MVVGARYLCPRSQTLVGNIRGVKLLLNLLSTSNVSFDFMGTILLNLETDYFSFLILCFSGIYNYNNINECKQNKNFLHLFILKMKPTIRYLFLP